MKNEKGEKIVRKRYGDLAKNGSSCCASAPTPMKSRDQKTLKIEWQRLISNDETCPRCGSTEEELYKAVTTLKQSLTPLGIKVTLTKKELTVSEFKKAPLQSNRILINNQLLEDYIEGSVGQSPCCDVCGPSECRTIKIEGQIYETIPSKIIIQAGLVAATQLVNERNEESSCSGE
jgi:hypothetical protein